MKQNEKIIDVLEKNNQALKDMEKISEKINPSTASYDDLPNL
jgi:hypothetical protein